MKKQWSSVEVIFMLFVAAAFAAMAVLALNRQNVSEGAVMIPQVSGLSGPSSSRTGAVAGADAWGPGDLETRYIYSHQAGGSAYYGPGDLETRFIYSQQSAAEVSTGGAEVQNRPAYTWQKRFESSGGTGMELTAQNSFDRMPQSQVDSLQEKAVRAEMIRAANVGGIDGQAAGGAQYQSLDTANHWAINQTGASHAAQAQGGTAVDESETPDFLNGYYERLYK